MIVSYRSVLISQPAKVVREFVSITRLSRIGLKLVRNQVKGAECGNSSKSLARARIQTHPLVGIPGAPTGDRGSGSRMKLLRPIGSPHQRKITRAAANRQDESAIQQERPSSPIGIGCPLARRSARKRSTCSGLKPMNMEYVNARLRSTSRDGRRSPTFAHLVHQYGGDELATAR